MNTLLLHRWQMVQEQVIYALRDVTVVQSLPRAIKEARTGKYDVIMVDVDTFIDGVENLSTCAMTVGITTRRDFDARAHGCTTVIWAGLSLDKFIEELEKCAKMDPDAYKPAPGLRWNQVVSFGDIALGQTQLSVLNLSCQGLTARQISSKMGNTEGYVKQVLRGLYEKFDVLDGEGNRRVRLVVAAMRMGAVV